jgi:HlyD family secretion protein
MDIPRSKAVVRNKKIRRAIYLVLTLAAVGGVSVYLSKLKPQAPPLERATQIIDTVRQEEFVVRVRGVGILTPEDRNFIAAETAGRVKARHIFAGMPVTPDTIIVTLTSPEAQQLLQNAELDFKKAETDYINRKVELEAGLLTQQASLAQLEAAYKNARNLADARVKLAEDKLIGTILLQEALTSAEELAGRIKLEKQRIDMNTKAVETQLAVAEATLQQQRAIYELRRRQVDNLEVKAGMIGILSNLTVEVGQPVTIGQAIAEVTDPKRLKAEIRIPETQARDIVEGQIATVDPHLGGPPIPGRVIRIDPSVIEGTKKVDIRLEGALPIGASPNQNVEGEVEITRMANIVQVQRPAFGQENSTVRLFRLTPDGEYAEAVQVKFGRSSVTQIQILEGLKVGDKVIVSDTSSQVPDTADRVHLR